MNPVLRFPFAGKHPVTFGFGVVPDSPTIKDQYVRWGLVGHNGLDFGMANGTEVLAADSGRVEQAGDNGDFVISVTIEHRWGQSLYAHLQEACVAVGTEVKKGESLGYSNQTGNAFGAHLHFAIKPAGADLANGYLGYVDPTPYFAREDKSAGMIKAKKRNIKQQKNWH